MSLVPLFDPKKRRPGPKPAKVNLRIVFGIGLAIWGAIFLYIVIFKMLIQGALPLEALLITSFGIVIGVMLMLWEVIFRDKYYGPEKPKRKRMRGGGEAH